jgi:hypothetical protein
MLRTARKLNRLVFAGFFLGVALAGSAQGMQPCPSRQELFENAQTVVEVRVRSLFIGASGLVSQLSVPSRMMRVELEVERVIKGKFDAKEVVAYGLAYPPTPLSELTWMAALYGLGDDSLGDETFEWEPALTPIGEELDEKFYSIGGCSYYRFPDFVEEISGTDGAFGNFERRPQP